MEGVEIKKRLVYENVLVINKKISQYEWAKYMTEVKGNLERNNITIYPQISINNAMEKRGLDIIVDMEVMILLGKKDIKKISKMYKVINEIVFENVLTFSYSGMVSEINSKVKEFQNYIQDNNIKLKSGLYAYLEDEVNLGAVFSTGKFEWFAKLE